MSGRTKPGSAGVSDSGAIRSRLVLIFKGAAFRRRIVIQKERARLLMRAIPSLEN